MTRQPDHPLTALIIDDEAQIRRLLHVTLEAANYRVIDAANGQEGLVHAATHRPDVVLLDLGLPDMDGVTVLKRLREWSSVPVIVISVREQDASKIAALDGGADDYLTKPFSTQELLARLRVAIRHSKTTDEAPVFQSGPLVVDLTTRRVSVSSKEIHLTTTEYALLQFMIQHAGRVLTHGHILRTVWGPNAEAQMHYLRVYIARLRDKIEMDPSHPLLLLTEPGVGYRLASTEY
jgi:two-component system KDP operon response regulator KdpE